MTTSAPYTNASESPVRQESAKTWDETAAWLTSRLAREDFRPGDLAELRRMGPDSTDSPVFLGLMAERGLFGSPEVERKWALVIHGIALMTPKRSNGGDARTAHDGQMPVGRALYLGGEKTRDQGFYSDTRLKRLLTSRGGMTRTLLARAFRMLSGDVAFNWRQMARFILNEGFNEEEAERQRYQIARDYYKAQFSSTQSSDDNG